MSVWILVADASRARFFSIKAINLLGESHTLQLIEERLHPESRQKDTDLVADKSGHFHSACASASDYDEESDPKKREAELFAAELCKILESGRQRNEFTELVLVCPPHFSGLLNKAANKNLLRMVVSHIEKDYTQDTLEQLSKKLKSHF